MIGVLPPMLCLLLAAAAARPAAEPAASKPMPATLHEGRSSYLPYASGPYRIPDSTGWRLDQRGASLRGDGVIGEDHGLTYGRGASSDRTAGSTILRLAAAHITLRDLVLSGPRWVPNPSAPGKYMTEAGDGDAISFLEPMTISGTVLDHVDALYPGRSCLRVAPAKNPDGSINFWVSPAVRDCNFYGAYHGDGVWVENMTDADWSRVTSTNHGGYGFRFIDCESSRFKLCAEQVTGGVYLKNCTGCVLDALHVEEFAGKGPTPAPGLVLDGCKGVKVSSSLFSSWGRPGAVSIRLINGCTHCLIEPSYHASVAVAVDVDSTCHDNTIYGQEGAPIRVDRKRNRVLD